MANFWVNVSVLVHDVPDIEEAYMFSEQLRDFIDNEFKPAGDAVIMDAMVHDVEETDDD